MKNLTLENIDKSNWKAHPFEKISKRIAEAVDPNITDLDIYYGLEHLDAESIHIRRNGIPGDVSGGKLKCYPGDVIFGKRRAYQRKAGIVTQLAICSAHSFVFRANEEIMDASLFPFFFHSDHFMHRMIDISVGGLSPTINWSDLKYQEFLLPPKAQQAELAELLWAMDKVIEKDLAVLEKLDKYKSCYISTHMIAKQNPSASVDLSFYFENNNIKNRSNRIDNVLTISAEKGLVNQEEYFKRSIASKDLSNYFVLKKGEFAYNKSYSLGYPAGAIKILENYCEGVVSPLYVCFKLKENFGNNYQKFFKLFFESGYLNQKILSVAKEGARNHGLLNISKIDFFKIKIPKIIIDQTKLEHIIACEKMVLDLQSKLASSKALQKSLLNQLF